MKWYEIKNKSADKAEVWIYDQIGEDFWTGGGVTAKGFQKELSEIKAKQIDLHINSPGGSVFDGITIYNLLKQHAASVTTYIDGLAASIASVIALAGDRVVMAENALFMIHNPSGVVMGDAADMRKTADLLDKIRSTMTDVYVKKTRYPDDEINSMLDAETWMTAKEAIEHGFVDEITEEMDLAACAKFVPVMSAAGFKSVPAALVPVKKNKHKAKDIERILRDGGCSEKMAKSILAEGYKGYRKESDKSEVAEADQRDVAAAAPAATVKDRIADILTRAEVVAPSK